MTRLAVSLLGAVGCADTDDIPQRGFDQDISSTHDASSPTLRNLSLRDISGWLFGSAQ